MPTTPVIPQQWYKSDGSAFLQQGYPESASMTSRAGDPVYVNGSGQVVACASPGNLVNATSNTSAGIWAIEVDDASGTTNATLFCDVVPEDNIFVTYVTHATPASAVTAATQVGQKYQIRVNATGSVGGFGVSLDNTANPMVEVVGIHPQYAVGEQYGWVYCKFLSTVRQLA